MSAFGPPSFGWGGGIDSPLQKSAHAAFYRLASADAGLTSTGVTVTGAQTTQQTGYQIGASTTWFSTVASGGACVLPETTTPFSLAGLFIQIINTSTNPLLIYPHPADLPNSINNGTTNASVTISGGAYALLHCVAPGFWAASSSTPIAAAPVITSVRSSSAATVTASATTDYFLALDPTANAITVNLPASPATGLSFLIKDATGQAGTHNITIAPASGNIDGASTFVINAAFQSVAVTYTGAQWSIN